ncbi:MFS transporter [Desulfocarbo indianensis]|nr:MFS transporter [Desulfocarbo indianensis]
MAQQRDRSRQSGYRWVVFVLLATGYFLVYFHRLCPSVVALDLMRDLSAGAALLGWLGSAYFYPYALMQLPAGLLSDSWGPRRTITVFFLLAGAASIFFGLALGVGWAILARVLVGLGISMLFVPTMKVLTKWFRTDEFSRMTGILMAVGGAGALFATTPLALLSAALGWRGSFVAIGVATLALAVAIWFLVRNTPQEMGLPPAEEPDPTAAANAQKTPAIGLWQGVGMVLGAARFWPLAVWFFFSCGIFFSFGGLWGGPYLMHVYGLSKPQAGNVLSMLAWAMIIGSPILSWLSDKVLRSRKKLLVSASLLLTALCALLAFWPRALGVPAMYVWCFFMSLAASAMVVIAFTSGKELFPVEIAGTSVGLVNLFPFLGGAVMQPVLGMVLEAQGRTPAGTFAPEAYGKAFLIYFFASLAALAASLMCKETFGRRLH